MEQIVERKADRMQEPRSPMCHVPWNTSSSLLLDCNNPSVVRRQCAKHMRVRKRIQSMSLGSPCLTFYWPSGACVRVYVDCHGSHRSNTHLNGRRQRFCWSSSWTSSKRRLAPDHLEFRLLVLWLAATSTWAWGSEWSSIGWGRTVGGSHTGKNKE